MDIGLQSTTNRAALNWLQRRIEAYARDWKRREPFDWRATLAILVGAVALTPLLLRMPNLGYEWHSFDLGIFYGTYPPWLRFSIAPLTVWDWRTGLAILSGLLYMSAAVSAAREACPRGRASMLSAAAAAITTGPFFITLWLGNVATITLFGLIALPVGVMFATVQPHLAPWALLARRQWMVWGIGFFALSIIAWGFWPQRYFDTGGVLDGVLAHPIAMGWQNLGWPVLVVGLAMLLFVNADPLRLIAVGAFLSPYIMPGHLVMLVPAIGRTSGYARVVLWLVSWLVFLPPMFAPELWSKYAAMLFPFMVYWFLRPRPEQAASI